MSHRQRPKMGVAPPEHYAPEIVPSREAYAAMLARRGPLCPGCGWARPIVHAGRCRACAPAAPLTAAGERRRRLASIIRGAP